MPGAHAAHLASHQASEPGTPEYELWKYMFLASGESPRSLMGHAVEWMNDAVAWLELAILVEKVPDRVLDVWVAGYRYAFEHDLPASLEWRSAGRWEPADGEAEWDNPTRSKCQVYTYDADHPKGAHVHIVLRTPRPYLRACAAFAAT